MRQLLLLCFLSLLGSLQAQNVVDITTDITANTTWTNDNIYVLKGQFIYVLNDATLTIEPGTIVKGEPAGLVVTRGCKLIANGTIDKPIVFTSAQPAGSRAAGDWGGISLLGKALVNCPGGECLLEGGVDPNYGKYGGTDDNDNSGSLKYVRIEFAGIAFQPNNETNGITMGGVGKGTTIENIQVSFGGDDSFEWFGGNVDAKNLVAFKTVDDMFDTDFGFTGNIQFGLGVSDPNIADVSGSNGFESDNDAQGSLNIPITNPTFSNITVLGPKADPLAVINTNFKRAMHLRRSARTDVLNSVLIGFPTGLRLESTNSENAYLTDKTLTLRSNVFSGMTKLVDSTSTNFKAVSDTLNTYNGVLDLTELKLTSLDNVNPQPWPQTGSPLLTGANFSNAPAFFSKVAYKGAFGTDNWTSCWCEFDPQNADYSKNLDYVGTVGDITNTINQGTVQFVAPATGNGYTYNWDFGVVNASNDVSTMQNPSFTYGSSGTYIVKVTITTQRGCKIIKTKTIDVLIKANEVIVNQDIITNTTWTNNNIYVMSGVSFIYVRDNATLTIEPGTIIKGNPAGLVVTRGSKLIAEGTVTQPIIFTSSKEPGSRTAGDWGGISLLGNALVNCPGGECLLEGGLDPVYGKYGGTDDNDNSGSLKYVRIEFAGIAFQPNNETNGITMGGVGKGTTIEHVQVSFGGDDSFEWFGGNVDGKNLVAFKTVDDMFDTDFGFTGNIQYGLGVSDPNIADISGSNGFESDNDAQGTLNIPITNPTFSNITIVGPKADPNAVINTNFRRAMHLRRSTRTDVLNSVLIGFPTGLRLESANSETAYLTDNNLRLNKNVMAGMTKNVDSTSTSFVAVKAAFGLQNEYKTLTELDVLSLSNTSPEPVPNSTSPLLTGADFNGASTYFDQVSFRGAFGTENWTKCWCEFDPQNADYVSTPVQNFQDPGEPEVMITGGNSVAFTAPAGSNLTYSWDFGVAGITTDVSSLENPTYVYQSKGTYTVTLTITNARGCVLVKTKQVDVTVATNEIKEVSQFVVYPNPVNDELTIQLNSTESFNAEYRFIQADGKISRILNNPIIQGSNVTNISVADLPAGYFILQVVTEKGVLNKKFVVKH